MRRGCARSSTPTLDSVGPAAPWVLSNHDVTRHLTRYGRANTSSDWQPDPGQPDLALGTRRARAAILLSLALPGSSYLYQGEELGLWEVEDIPDELIADPIWDRTGHLVRGRDGCRVPLPWAADEPGFGFGRNDLAGSAGPGPWLPQPAAWRELAVDAQTGDPGSMLELYRAALRRTPQPGRARRGPADLASGGRRRPGLHPARRICLRRQHLRRPGSPARSRGGAAGQRRARRRAAAARHRGLAAHRRLSAGSRQSTRAW